MSARKPDNPALFTDPCSPSAALCGPITLRDWFAGQAIAGLVQRRVEKNDPKELCGDWERGFYYELKSASVPADQSESDMLADDAYDIADAMLAAREAKQ